MSPVRWRCLPYRGRVWAGKSVKDDVATKLVMVGTLPLDMVIRVTDVTPLMLSDEIPSPMAVVFVASRSAHCLTV